MPEAPDAAHVRHLARLARLDLDDGEADALAAEAARILAAFGALPRDAEAAGAPATPFAGRADEPARAPAAVVEAILAAVARKDGRLVKVPRGGE